MPSIGITGNIACGKTTVTQLLAEALTTTPFNADQEVSHLLDYDLEVAQDIKQHFGPTAYDHEGKPNRALLRSLITQDPHKKQILEEILHPRLRTQWQPQATAAFGNPDLLFLAEIPLLYEKELSHFFDTVILVASSEQTQRNRLIQDRHLSKKTAQQLIALQMPLHNKIEKATFVLWNDGSQELLEQQISLLMHQSPSTSPIFSN